MTPAEISAIVVAATRAAVDAAELDVAVPDSVTVERPRERAHGDYATNVAMRLARPAGRPAREVAEILAVRLRETDGIAAVDVAGPGFLNVWLTSGALGELAATIVAAGDSYGRNDVGGKRKINLEFVSANPTGPMHVGHARWAAVGDALARLLEATGHDVTREFYVNDAGAQTDRLAASLLAAARHEPIPEGGYHGDYIPEAAAAIVADHPEALGLPEEAALATFKAEGLARLLAEIRASLDRFGVRFDVYTSERSLHDAGEIDRALARLSEQGWVYDADGATWLRTAELGDDKDRVLIRSDATPTYFAADCAYYLDKRERGAEQVIIQVGADHAGYVGRMRAMVAAYGDDPTATFALLIGQLVSVSRHGQPVRMSKRSGTFVAFDDVVDAVGVDAARYSLTRASIDATLDLDLDLVTRHDPENPVFYVQYAHARICSLLRHASDLGVDRGDRRGFRPELLDHDREVDLLGALGEFGRVVAAAADLREPHRVARYLESLAGTYHRFYDACRVLPHGDEAMTDLARARLWLCTATRVVLSSGLGLLGVTAPERM
jgi:arginyl-tRNA synthetase